MTPPPVSTDLNVRPGLFRNGVEALRVLGIVVFLTTPLWGAVGFAVWLIARSGR